MGSNRRARRFNSAEEVLSQRVLSQYAFWVLSQRGAAGSILYVNAEWVRLIPTSSITAIMALETRGFIRPSNRWRLYYPAAETERGPMPPFCAHIELRRGKEGYFSVRELKVRWIHPPSNHSVDEMKRRWKEHELWIFEPPKV